MHAVPPLVPPGPGAAVDICGSMLVRRTCHLLPKRRRAAEQMHQHICIRGRLADEVTGLFVQQIPSFWLCRALEVKGCCSLEGSTNRKC